MAEEPSLNIALTVGILALAALMPLDLASAQNARASKDEIKAACRADVEAINPRGSLSTRRQTRNALINECIEKRKKAAK
jgi:hypothetical protein